MTKKLVAVTGIKHNGTEYPAGETLPAGEFTKDELKTLHDNGALTIVDDTKVEDVREAEKASTPVTTPVGPDTSAPVKETAKEPEKDSAKK